MKEKDKNIPPIIGYLIFKRKRKTTTPKEKTQKKKAKEKMKEM